MSYRSPSGKLDYRNAIPLHPGSQGSGIALTFTDAPPYLEISVPDDGHLHDGRYYHPGNILGIVSQSGGTPTGALMEHGRNANGEYWRYAGGLLICNIASTTGSTGQKTFTLPSNLVNTSTCTVHGIISSTSDNTITCKHGSITSTSVLMTFNIVTSTVLSAYLLSDIECRIVVIGRWF